MYAAAWFTICQQYIVESPSRGGYVYEKFFKISPPGGEKIKHWQKIIFQLCLNYSTPGGAASQIFPET